MEIYTGPFTKIKIIPEHSALVVSWSDESQTLDEAGVKFEINRIPAYVIEYDIQHIIVDTRNYRFRDNDRIQQWINHTYMPRIMETGVKKYALVVDGEVNDPYADFDDLDAVLPVVEYFNSTEKALKWIES